MHYSPSDKDGVFVVEVARGADTSYHSPRTTTAPQQFNCDLLGGAQEQNAHNLHQQQQRVQVHHHPPPPDTLALNGVGGDGGIKSKSNSTGLSQSDLSDSSSGGGSNREYGYGGQGSAYAATEEELRGINKGASAVGGIQQLRSAMVKQETIDLEPRLQSDIDLFNSEAERREHCNGHPSVAVKSTTAPAAAAVAYSQS